MAGGKGPIGYYLLSESLTVPAWAGIPFLIRDSSMSKFTLRDAQTAISGLADGQAALLAAIQNLAQQNGSHPLSNAVSANLVAPVGQPIITRDERHSADVTASVQQANANGHLNLDDVSIDNENRQIPEDNPHKEGPCWAT